MQRRPHSSAAALPSQEGTMNLVQALYLNNKVAPFDTKLRSGQALCYALDSNAGLRSGV
jgi:peptide/nickel transport system substrate-binding protein